MGVSQGWTVKGRFLTVIQAGQADLSSLVSKGGAEDREDFLEASSQGSLKESLEMPAFFRAILVARLENMVAPGFAVPDRGRGKLRVSSRFNQERGIHVERTSWSLRRRGDGGNWNRKEKHGEDCKLKHDQGNLALSGEVGVDSWPQSDHVLRVLIQLVSQTRSWGTTTPERNKPSSNFWKRKPCEAEEFAPRFLEHAKPLPLRG